VSDLDRSRIADAVYKAIAATLGPDPDIALRRATTVRTEVTVKSPGKPPRAFTVAVIAHRGPP
jgi:hypothetical protein